MASKRVLEVAILGDAKSVERAYAAATGSGKKFAKNTKGFHATVGSSFGQMAKNAAKAAVGIGLAYKAIEGAKKAVETTETLASATEKLHRNFGLSIKTGSTWAAVLQANGVDAGSAHMAFTTLAKSLSNLEKGSKPATAAFKDLGLSQKDLAGKSFEQSLGKVTKALTDMRGGTKRAADAQTLFGRGAKLIAPLLRSDGLGFQAQAKWAREYGVTLDGHAIKSSKQMKIASEQLKFAQMGLEIQFTEKVAPALLKVEGAGLKVLKVFRDPNLTSDQKWARVSAEMEKLAQKGEKAFERAFPKIINFAAANAPRAASAFVRAWLNAGIWGKLFTIALIAKKIGVFSSVGSMAVKAFAARFIPGMAAAGAAGGEAAAGGEGLASAGALGKFRLGGKLAAGAFMAALTFEAVKNAPSIADKVAHLIMPLFPTGGPNNLAPHPAQKGTPLRNFQDQHKANPNLTPNQFNQRQHPGTTAPTHHPHGKASAAHAAAVKVIASAPMGHASTGGYRPCTLTWYDPALGGINSGDGSKDPHHPTADGTPYDPNAMACAAPPNYAFGTRIQFVYGGRSIICVVNDRGGAIQGAHFDLTRGAAQTLGTYSAGLANAQFKVVGRNSSLGQTKGGGGGSPKRKGGPGTFLVGGHAISGGSFGSGGKAVKKVQPFHMPSGGIPAILKGATKGSLFPLDAQINVLTKDIDKFGNNSNPAAKKFVSAMNRVLAKKTALKDFRDAIASIKDEMSSLSDEAAGNFQNSLEAAIQNGPASTTLAQMQREDSINSDTDSVTQAKDDLAKALRDQNPQEIRDAQKALDDAQRSQKEDDLQRQIDDQEAGVQAQVDQYKAGLDKQLGDLVTALGNQTITYKQFVADVNGILSGLGITYAGSADIEFSISGLVKGGGSGAGGPVKGGKVKNPFFHGSTPNPFAHTKGFASGGVIFRANEVGQETFYRDGAGRTVIRPASQSAGRSGAVVNIEHADMRTTASARDLADRLAFRIRHA
jgi:rare lipoprotein A (peptidoglycan hydrolase)